MPATTTSDAPAVDPSFDYDVPFSAPYEFMSVGRPRGDACLPKELRRRILVHTIHDGQAIPRKYRFRPDGTPIVDPDLLDKQFVAQRDWGANFVAHQLARELGLPRYGRVRLARVLLDFNRFPGSTPPATYSLQDLLAISSPFAEALSYQQKAALLEEYYDPISDILEAEGLPQNLLTIAVHTYDEHNPSLTRRSEVSLITRPAAYQQESRMPFGVFDPMYPDRLGESTCSRILRDRISLNLERGGFRVSHNHPYPLPNGSLEVRAQVWYFFNYLRKRFEEDFPETREELAYQLVWAMLLNTNLRMAESEALRGFLHRYRRVPRSQEARFRKAQQAYVEIYRYLRDTDVANDYRGSQDRPGCLGIEVRKDLVCHIDRATGRPQPRTKEAEGVIHQITHIIAEAIGMFFEHDREIELQRVRRPAPPPPSQRVPPPPPSRRGRASAPPPSRRGHASAPPPSRRGR